MSAIAMIAEEQNKFMKSLANKENTPPCRKKHRYSSDSSNNSTSEEEPTPPPKPPKRKKKKRKGKKEKKIEYKVGNYFQIGMKLMKIGLTKRGNNSSAHTADSGSPRSYLFLSTDRRT